MDSNFQGRALLNTRHNFEPFWGIILFSASVIRSLTVGTLTTALFPTCGRKTVLRWEFLRFLQRLASLGSRRRRDGECGSGVASFLSIRDNLNDSTRSEQIVVSCSDRVGSFFAYNHCDPLVIGFFVTRNLCRFIRANGSKSNRKTCKWWYSDPLTLPAVLWFKVSPLFDVALDYEI